MCMLMACVSVGVLMGCSEASNQYEVLSSFANNDASGCNWNQITILVDNHEKMSK